MYFPLLVISLWPARRILKSSPRLYVFVIMCAALSLTWWMIVATGSIGPYAIDHGGASSFVALLLLIATYPTGGALCGLLLRYFITAPRILSIMTAAGLLWLGCLFIMNRYLSVHGKGGVGTAFLFFFGTGSILPPVAIYLSILIASRRERVTCRNNP